MANNEVNGLNASIAAATFFCIFVGVFLLFFGDKLTGIGLLVLAQVLKD